MLTNPGLRNEQIFHRSGKGLYTLYAACPLAFSVCVTSTQRRPQGIMPLKAVCDTLEFLHRKCPVSVTVRCALFLVRIFRWRRTLENGSL